MASFPPFFLQLQKEAAAMAAAEVTATTEGMTTLALSGLLLELEERSLVSKEARSAKIKLNLLENED